MKKTLIERLSSWLRPRLRLYAIYLELGYNPWRKPRKVRKKGKGVYFGVKEAIPFVNGALMGILLFIDYRQLLRIKSRPALGLTLKTGLWYLLLAGLFYLLLGGALVLVAYSRMG